MNPLKHFFLQIIFLMAGLQVETAYSAGGEAAGNDINGLIDFITANKFSDIINPDMKYEVVDQPLQNRSYSKLIIKLQEQYGYKLA
ncbi:MAG: hypothetical protein IPH94_21540 [Saprospiraceae bacterium]|nr:hypothetical protein [Saprospiraceae bacterium]